MRQKLSLETLSAGYPPESRLKRVLRLGFCIIGILSPFDTFPHPSRSCLPLGAMEIAVSISCLILLPRVWRSAFGVPRPWVAQEGQGWMTERRWRLVSATVSFVALGCIIGSVGLMRPWRPHRVNWSEIVAAPAYILLCWSAYINQYILQRRPATESGMITLNLSGGSEGTSSASNPVTAQSS